METLVADKIDFLKDLSIYKNKVNLLIHDENTIIKESYRTFENVSENANDTCPYAHTKIQDIKSYNGNITTFNIRAIDDIIVDYKGEGPVIDTTVNQITTSSDKDFYNRRCHDIGKKLQTGDIKGSTIVDYHTMYQDIMDCRVPGFINTNIFKSTEKDPENPYLDTTINTEFFYDDNKDNTTTILIAREIRQRYRKNGDIYDYKRSNMKYGYDITGELIKLDSKAKQLFEGDKADIVPRLKIVDGKYIVRYVSMDKPFDSHVTETYICTDDEKDNAFILTNLLNNDIKVSIDFKWTNNPIEQNSSGCYEYKATHENGEYKYITEGYINRPNSGDMFMYAGSSEEDAGFTKLAYFQNIYSGDADGSYFLTNNYLTKASIVKEDGWYLNYTYEYNEYGHIISQKRDLNGYVEEVSSYSEKELDDDLIVMETCMLADPTIKKNKKSIFYMVSVVDKNTKEIVKQYRVVSISQN